MPPESQIPIASHTAGRRFATRLALFYGTLFGVLGTHLPFFPVWLKAVGIDASWIGIINAVPAVTRFTTLPFVTGIAERRHALRGAMMLAAFATALGFAAVGTQHQPLPLFLVYIATCVLWTPSVPLTDAYALRGVARYGLNYGPLRLWGSAAFVAGALACGLLVDIIAARELIWVIVAFAARASCFSRRMMRIEKPLHPRGATACCAIRPFWRSSFRRRSSKAAMPPTTPLPRSTGRPMAWAGSPSRACGHWACWRKSWCLRLPRASRWIHGFWS
jgi:PPP family 3-phenylpropionic acid transporter